MEEKKSFEKYQQKMNDYKKNVEKDPDYENKLNQYPGFEKNAIKRKEYYDMKD